MSKLYFLPGLGGNIHHAKDFFDHLHLPITFLDLPDDIVDLQDLDNLKVWFEKSVDLSEKIVLIGHSIGADLAAYFASQYQSVTHLILLDGGILNFDQLISLEEEMADTQRYIAQTIYLSIEAAIEAEKIQSPIWTKNLEAAVRASFIEKEEVFHLNVSETAILALLRLRRRFQLAVKQIETAKILLLIPEVGEETPDFKKEALKQLPSSIKIEQLPHCGHALYTERAGEVASAIQLFLN